MLSIFIVCLIPLGLLGWILLVSMLRRNGLQKKTNGASKGANVETEQNSRFVFVNAFLCVLCVSIIPVLAWAAVFLNAADRGFLLAIAAVYSTLILLGIAYFWRVSRLEWK